MSGRVATPPAPTLPAAPVASLLSAVAWVTVGRDREERQRGVGVCACPAALRIDIKVKTTFFWPFSLLLFWYIFAPWVVCHVRLSEVRELRRGARRGQLVLCGDLLGRVLHKFELFRISSLKT